MALEEKTVKLVNHTIEIDPVDVVNLEALVMAMKGDINQDARLILHKPAVNYYTKVRNIIVLGIQIL
jgi:hypothetical protein